MPLYVTGGPPENTDYCKQHTRVPADVRWDPEKRILAWLKDTSKDKSAFSAELKPLKSNAVVNEDAVSGRDSETDEAKYEQKSWPPDGSTPDANSYRSPAEQEANPLGVRQH